tara:strand:- start:3778 stop:4833 length:1056 start_codon:yes stop_codon:yes gene_type:complete
MLKDNREKNTPKSFFSQGAYGCVMYPRIRCDGSVSKSKKKEMSKIVENIPLSDNEIKMGKKINELMKGKSYKPLIGVYRHCKVKKQAVKKYNNCNIIRNDHDYDSKFFILYSKFIDSDKLRTHMKKQDFDNNSFLHVYISVLDGLSILINNNIVHNDFTENNIIVSKNDEKHVHIIDFGMSVCIDDFIEDNDVLYNYLFQDLFWYDHNYVYWSFDRQLIGFMIKYNKKPSNKELYSMISKYYSNRNNILFHKTDYFKDYIQKTYDMYLDSFLMSKSLEVCIYKLLSYTSKTWDLYSFGYLLLKYLLNNSILDKNKLKPIINMCKQAIHYDYTKRPSIAKHKESYKLVTGNL